MNLPILVMAGVPTESILPSGLSGDPPNTRKKEMIMFARIALVVGFIVVTVTFGGGVMAQAIRVSDGINQHQAQMMNP